MVMPHVKPLNLDSVQSSNQGRGSFWLCLDNWTRELNTERRRILPVMTNSYNDPPKVRSCIKSICEGLWRRVGVDPYGASQSWSIELLRNGLESWEFNFLIAAMNARVRVKGGWVQALLVQFDDPESDVYLHPDELIAAWREIGSEATVRAIQFGLRRLFFLRYQKFEDLSQPEWDQLEAQMDEAFGQDQPDVNALLASYAERHHEGAAVAPLESAS